MDIALMYNFSVIGMTTWYYLMRSKNEQVLWIACMGVTIVALNFIIVMVYHFLVITGKLKPLQMQCERTISSLKVQLISKNVKRTSNNDGSKYFHSNKFSDSCSNYREPYWTQALMTMRLTTEKILKLLRLFLHNYFVTVESIMIILNNKTLKILINNKWGMNE